jgi:hypothetical protein
MANTLPVSRLVNATITLTQSAAQSQNTSTLLILGTSNVIDPVSRFRTYSDIADLATDFGTSAEEYKAAVLWFEQAPQPASVMVGRWAKTAVAAQLFGATLSAAQQSIAAWNAVTTPAFSITINGSPYTISPASFGTSTNLNGIAALIQTALAAAVAGSTCVWNSTFQQFQITDGMTGVASTLSFATAPTAFGSITFAVNPSAAATITIGGTAVTFVTSLTTGNQILIGATLAATLANAVTFLNQSADVNLSKATYSVNQASTALQIVYKTPGAAGNTFTLAASVATPSGATLTGGSGTDISAMLGMTAASSGAYVSQGIAAESALSAVTLFDQNYGQQWYAVTVPSAIDADHLLIAPYIEATTTKHFYGVSTQEAAVLVASDTTNIAYQLKLAGYKKTAVQYSSSNAYAAVSLLARILTTDYTGNNTVITLKFKQEPGIVAENINTTQANALEAFNCNVFVAYDNNTAIIEQGVCCSGDFIDSVMGADNLAIDIQNAVFNLLYTSTTKIPQTDAGNHLILTTMEQVCAQYVTNGFLAPGTWNSSGFGTLNEGDYMPKGFYVFAPPIATQNQANRAARKSVAFQIAAKEAGAIHSANIAITVNQ